MRRILSAPLLLFPCLVFLAPLTLRASPSTDPSVLAHRGKIIGGSGETVPMVALTAPDSGWTAAMQIPVTGTCSDNSADPVEVNINGTRYYIRSRAGSFSRKFPAAAGKNTVIVQCRNKAGIGQATAVVDAAIPHLPLKIVLTSDTDSTYTDLHIYEPDGTHVYWASTQSPSGGLFFLNEQGGSFDEPGYGPYLYVHPAAPVGVFRIDVNYWPGGAMQHTLANLDVVLNEGTPDETRKRIRKPLAHPDETQTLAYVVIRPNRSPAQLFVPGQDPDDKMPAEVKDYRKRIEPLINSNGGTQEAFLTPLDESSMRAAVVGVALHQAQKLSPRWEPSQRDCAGLVRFAFREALRPRSAAQFAALGVTPKLFLPTVSEVARRLFPVYPRIWRVSEDIDHIEGGNGFKFFADAETLVSYNFRPRARSLDLAKPGDLLVYRRSMESAQPFHLMLVARAGPKGAVVYHNGRTGDDAAVRIVTFADLNSADDTTWMPLAKNPNFLGVYQWTKFQPERQSAL